MRVCLLCRRYYPSVGGIETSIYQLSRQFAEMGHEVVIVTTTNPPNERRKEYADIVYANISFKLLNIVPPLHLDCLEKQMKKRISQLGKLDIIISRDSFLTCVANRICKGIPVIYIPSMDVKEFAATKTTEKKNLRQQLLKILERWALSIEIKNQASALYRSSGVIAFCQGMVRQLKKSYHKFDYTVKVCYPGCTLADPGDLGDIVNEKPHFLYVGRISEEKNLVMLFEALTYLSDDLKLTIVGDGSGMAELRQMAQKLGSNITVEFAGFQADVLPYYINADFFILPSKYESFGQVVIESFTCGVPVIGFCTIEGKTNTAVGELVMDDVTGFVCRQFDAETLAENIKKAIVVTRHPERKKQMGQACRKFAQDACSWHHLAEVCLEIGGKSSDMAQFM